MKLSLGTAQFGLPYGISNVSGQTLADEVREIISAARANGVLDLDTAIAYGTSETVLGESGVENFRVVTKLPPLPSAVHSVTDWVNAQVLGSLQRLRINKLYGLLLHNPLDLFGGRGIELARALNLLRSFGKVLKIGVSVYSPNDLARILDVIKLDIIQAPLNIVDRRLETSGWLSRLKEQNIEVHTRSVFLQGLLLIKPDDLPTQFKHMSKQFNKWREVSQNGIESMIRECLAYPLSLHGVDRVVVGVESLDQLVTLFRVAAAPHSEYDLSTMISDDPLLINPSNWKKL